MTSKEEKQIYNAQCEWIEQNFGPDRSCNLGWGVGDVDVCTKIYGADGGYLSSYIEDGDVIHNFEPFEEED